MFNETERKLSARYRQRYRRLPELVLLGLGTGLLTALLIILFRLLLSAPQDLIAWWADIPSLVELPTWARFLLPVLGATILGLYWEQQNADSRRVGIAHIHERLSYHNGDLPMHNLINQLVGATFAIGTGHPVGREGPAVHIGAALSSWFGSHLGMPLSTQRLLIGCGSAAAIAALFHLPLAGILFAMEVVLLEYNLIGFTAIIISAVSADTLTQIALGEPEGLQIGIDRMALHLEIPLLLILAACIAGGAWLFQQIQIGATHLKNPNLLARFLCSGLIVGLIAVWFPQILTPVHFVIFNTVEGLYPLSDLVAFILIYACITPFIIGLAIPGGVIGPSLLLGALMGALVSTLFNLLGADTELSVYALIGMAAMMSAVIHAPLAALIAVFELSGDTHTLAAAMLVIVTSDLLMRAVLGKPSIFERLLQNQGLSMNTRVFRRVMMSTGVTELMSRSFLDTEHLPPISQPIQERPKVDWIVLQESEQFYLLASPDREADDDTEQVPTFDTGAPEEELEWVTVTQLDRRSTLLQALEQFERTKCSFAVVTDRQRPVGILTERSIHRFYEQKAE